jgi:WD40 repeat protein/serine/threonine protein kinase
MVDRVGQQFGNYRLTRLLGRGSVAEVYLAEHVRLSTQAAIKVLHAQLTGEEATRFQQETYIVASLTHPHIARILDFAVQEDTPFLVMDYAPNGTLRQRFPRGTPLAPGVVLPYVQQVADALLYTHGQRLIHQNIKPENMLLNQRNEVLLSDFGIAPAFQDPHYQPSPETSGAATYLAPEQIQGHPRPASDQYALAAVVYEWLSGTPPFQGTMTEVMANHLFTEPVFLRDRIRTISPAIEAVVMGALAKDPADRFPSIQAFAEAFEEACQAMPALLFMSPRPVTPPAIEGKQPKKPAFVPSVTRPITLTPPAAPALEWATEPKGAPVTPARPAQLPPAPTPPVTPPHPRPFVPPVAKAPPVIPPRTAPPTPPVVEAPPTLERKQWKTAWTPAPAAPAAPPAFEPPEHPQRGISRRTVLVGGVAGLIVVGGTLTWLGFLRSPSSTSRASNPTAPVVGATPTPTPMPAPQGTTLFTYRGHSSFLRSVSWSPGGTRIASASDDHTVQLWDAFTGNNAIICRGHSRAVMSVAWSPDGTRIASGSLDQTVRIWDTVTGKTIASYTHGNNVMSVAWSPDGKYLASGSRDETVQIRDTSTWQLVRRLYAPGRVHAVAWAPDGKRLASGDEEGLAVIWNVSAWSRTLTYRRHTGTVIALAWAPDGKQVASGADLPDTTVQCWDAASGTPRWTAHSQTNTPSLGWAPDGTSLAAGGSAASLLNPATGNQLFKYPQNAWGLAWSPDGATIACGGQDGAVRVWQAT